jgi:hypothetical protein
MAAKVGIIVATDSYSNDCGKIILKSGPIADPQTEILGRGNCITKRISRTSEEMFEKDLSIVASLRLPFHPMNFQ